MSRKLKNHKSLVRDSSGTFKLILDAYVRLCLEIGPTQVTLETIADKAKVALGTVRYHFAASEKDIVEQAILHVLSQGYAFVDDGIYQERLKRGCNPLHAYVNVMYRWILKQRHNASFLVYYYYLSTTETEFAVENEAFLKRARMRISSLLLEAVGSGLYTKPDDPFHLATEIHSIILGGWITAILERTEKSLNFHRENSIRLIDLMLSGKK